MDTSDQDKALSDTEAANPTFTQLASNDTLAPPSSSLPFIEDKDSSSLTPPSSLPNLCLLPLPPSTSWPAQHSTA